MGRRGDSGAIGEAMRQVLPDAPMSATIHGLDCVQEQQEAQASRASTEDHSAERKELALQVDLQERSYEQVVQGGLHAEEADAEAGATGVESGEFFEDCRCLIGAI